MMAMAGMEGDSIISKLGVASEFVNDNLKVDGNRLIGKQTGKEVNLILKMHRGTNLSEPETSALIKHFLAIQSRAGLYRQKCIICHDSAVKLARQRLILHDGKLYGRYSGINIEPFLNSHGRLTEREIIVVTDMVKSQLSTASSN